MVVTHVHNAEKKTSLTLEMEPFRTEEEETWRGMIERKKAEVGKTWKKWKWLTKNSSEWRKHVCAYTSWKARREGKCSLCRQIPKFLKVMMMIIIVMSFEVTKVLCFSCFYFLQQSPLLYKANNSQQWFTV